MSCVSISEHLKAYISWLCVQFHFSWILYHRVINPSTFKNVARPEYMGMEWNTMSGMTDTRVDRGRHHRTFDAPDCKAFVVIVYAPRL